ncbi:MAG: nucleoside kinase [Bacteroidales bacterium]|nr:nucleoside kinase [Bacteroidales bacterium]
MLQIYCRNTKTTKSFPEGTTLQEMLPEFVFEQPYEIVSARVNNVSQGLKFRVYNNRDVEFVDVRDAAGARVYFRSLCFVLGKAARDVFPGSKIYMENPISNGYYCNLHKADESQVTDDDIEQIRQRMQEIINKDIPFHRHEVQTEEAVRIFRERGFDDKVKLIESSGQVYMDYYTLGDTADYYYGRLLPSAGYIKVWGLERYYEGLLLRLPDRHNPNQLAPCIPQPKTFEMFNENLKWNIIMGLNNVGDVNKACLDGHASELIRVSEALQEKKIVQIAEEIDRRFQGENGVRLVLITGPSSSGKTTFCKRLSVQLMACGLRPLSFSTDDYFVNREDTPKLPNGSYDFDNFEAVKHEELQHDLLRLLNGETVDIPEFNFVTGRQEYNGKKLHLDSNTVVLLEGIHALNPMLSNHIPETLKFKIFINTLTSTSLDDHNIIPTYDNRLLRRIVRDYNKGAFTARQTIDQWPNVIEAEEKWIYPYQENADMMFNSSYLLEFAVMRNHAEVILATVPKNCRAYAEARRLQKFIHYFTPVPDKEIPQTSMIREFI